MAAVGHAWSDELQRQVAGMNALDVAATVHRILRPSLPAATCQHIMRDGLVEAYRVATIPEVPGASAMVARLAGRVPMAVASGSPMEGIEIALRQIGLAGRFDLLITSETVRRGKPHPDVFLAAAERLGVRAAGCVVFEDSQHGARAAQSAGMRCIVRPSVPPEHLAGLPCRVVTSWDEVEEQDVFVGT
jgi:beta-phosphoglucomutase-like phosphatase (HAD superfamily)